MSTWRQLLHQRAMNKAEADARLKLQKTLEQNKNADNERDKKSDENDIIKPKDKKGIPPVTVSDTTPDFQSERTLKRKTEEENVHEIKRRKPLKYWQKDFESMLNTSQTYAKAL